MATRTRPVRALLLAALVAAGTVPAALAPAFAQQRSTLGRNTSTGGTFGRAQSGPGQGQGDSGPRTTPKRMSGGQHLGTLAVQGMGHSVAGHSDNHPGNDHLYGKQGGH